MIFSHNFLFQIDWNNSVLDIIIQRIHILKIGIKFKLDTVIKSPIVLIPSLILLSFEESIYNKNNWIRIVGII